MILFSIIIIHEIGHLLAALYFEFNIYKINIYPFGGYIQFNDKLNRPLIQELIILLGGPLLQIIYFLILSFFHNGGLITIYEFNIIVNYHYSLLLFNMLPIFPLDGSKLVNIILSKFVSFKRSHLLMIYISYITLLIFLLSIKYIGLSINMCLLLFLLLSKLIVESKNHNLIFNRFLLERYLYDFNFKKVKLIVGEKVSRIMKDMRHIFIINDLEVTEKQLLKKRFKK